MDAQHFENLIFLYWRNKAWRFLVKSKWRKNYIYLFQNPWWWGNVAQKKHTGVAEGMLQQRCLSRRQAIYDCNIPTTCWEQETKLPCPTHVHYGGIFFVSQVTGSMLWLLLSRLVSSCAAMPWEITHDQSRRQRGDRCCPAMDTEGTADTSLWNTTV